MSQWKICQSEKGYGSSATKTTTVRDAKDSLVCTLNNKDITNRRASLIVLAPELFDLCKSAIDILKGNIGIGATDLRLRMEAVVGPGRIVRTDDANVVGHIAV